MNRTVPFWERDIIDDLLAGVLQPIDLVENRVLLTDAERATLAENFKDTEKRFLTIYKPEEISPYHQANARIFIPKMIALENDYGYELIWTSIYRSYLHQIRIYKAKGITDLSKIPLSSHHMNFHAGDAVPAKKPIAHFHNFLVEKKEAKLNEHGLFMEHPKATPSWGHVSDLPFKSYQLGGTRLFYP